MAGMRYKNGEPGRTPKTFTPFILGSAGAFGVRIYRSFGSSFTSAGVYVFCRFAVLHPKIVKDKVKTPLSVASVKVLTSGFLSLPLTVSVYHLFTG
jgi:hypothetical protein